MSEKPANSGYPLTEFRNLTHPIIDVRSPLEFSQGHLPGAVNIPLFSNSERELIGKSSRSLSRNLAMCSKPDVKIEIEDGYVSRIKVSTWGYGKVLYINHPDGNTSVYAHMLKFNDKIENLEEKIYFIRKAKIFYFIIDQYVNLTFSNQKPSTLTNQILEKLQRNLNIRDLGSLKLSLKNTKKEINKYITYILENENN